jgi:hypothetical protein
MTTVAMLFKLDPPDGLNPEQRAVWFEIVPPLAADGFPAGRESDLYAVLRSLVDSTIDVREAEAAVERFGRFTDAGRETPAARALKMARNRRQRDLLHVRQARKVRKRAPGGKPAVQVPAHVAQLAAEIPDEQRWRVIRWLGYEQLDDVGDPVWDGVLSGDAALTWVGFPFNDDNEKWGDPDYDPEADPTMFAINDARFGALYVWVKERHPRESTETAGLREQS